MIWEQTPLVLVVPNRFRRSECLTKDVQRNSKPLRALGFSSSQSFRESIVVWNLLRAKKRQCPPVPIKIFTLYRCRLGVVGGRNYLHQRKPRPKDVSRDGRVENHLLERISRVFFPGFVEKLKESLDSHNDRLLGCCASSFVSRSFV